MSNRPYHRGIKALQELLPPLEDCPGCGAGEGRPARDARMPALVHDFDPTALIARGRPRAAAIAVIVAVSLVLGAALGRLSRFR